MEFDWIKKRILRQNKICPICKNSFDSYYSTQIYCNICKKLNSLQKKKRLGIWEPKTNPYKCHVKKKCKFCGKEFTIVDKRSKKIFCCKDHSRKARFYTSLKEYERKKLGKRRCKVCGKEFLVSSKTYRTKVYCSSKCRAKEAHSKLPKKGNHKFNILRTCMNCGKQFKHSRLKHGQYFCSKSCFYDFVRTPKKCTACGIPIKGPLRVEGPYYCKECKEIYC